MKRELISTLLVATLATSLQAGGDIGGVVEFVNPDSAINATEVKKEVVKETPKVEPKVEKEKAEKDFYTVIKGMRITGDSTKTLDADAGFGVGLDIGYRLGKGFATEIDLSFAKSDLNTPTKNEASYKTASLALVYTLPITETMGLFAKAGYVKEQTKVNALNIDETDSGIVYSGGLEYKLNDNYGIVAEYEGSTIDDSIRGDSISLGVMYNF